MISNPSTETRIIGRYALHWDHITDWHKINMRRRMAKRAAVPAANIVQPVSPETPTQLQQPTTYIPPVGTDDTTGPKSAMHKEAEIPQENTEKLIELEKQSHEVLFKANTVFPFILFPHTIILDRTHLTIIHRMFFGMAKITCVRIEDILTADLYVSPFFGALKVATRFFINQETGQGNGNETKSPSINFLRKHDALEVHKLLQGFIAATQKEIDTSQIEKHELIKLLRGLGANDDTKYEGRLK